MADLEPLQTLEADAKVPQGSGSPTEKQIRPTMMTCDTN
jgi:hypothetical protein